ncbi:ThiF family adenylyltransferase [Lysinibacillus mangiferihumi]|uniref:ThiF family adenylyltransferase n=1 Tax=Lysinibacillus mangiferihumi TaxID=1130819 RepID=A0A4U2XY67_9BACI|nr:ThiF family adenylyltransferase [Lysinibacillus mangiferihumi]
MYKELDFYVIDFDFVEASNLNRQVLYKDEDIGKRKTEAIINNVLKRTKIRTIDREVKEPDDLSNIDFENMNIIVNCADKPRDIEYIIARFCEHYNIPFVSASVGIETGTWGPIYDESNKFPYNNLNLFTHGINGSISPTNSIIGSFLAYDVFIYLFN